MVKGDKEAEESEELEELEELEKSGDLEVEDVVKGPEISVSEPVKRLVLRRYT